MTMFNKLTACVVCCNESDGCQVSFAPKEHTVGTRGKFFDGAMVRVIEVNTPQHANSHCCTLYHCNGEYALA